MNTNELFELARTADRAISDYRERWLAGYAVGYLAGLRARRVLRNEEARDG